MIKARKLVAASAAAVALTCALGAPNAAATTADLALRTSLLNAHNNARNCSNGDLALNSKLNTSAQHHANDMAERSYFSHNTLAPASAASGADYTSTDWGYRIHYWGYENGYIGENLAKTYSTVSGVMAAWMASPDHKANIMDCHYKYVGFGFNSVGNKWVADFGGYRS